MRQYELIYVLSPAATEEDVANLHTEVEEVVGRMNGELENTENWGRRKLAYDIGPHREGTYVLELIRGNGDLIRELDRRLKVRDHVIRHLVVRIDEERQVVERTQSRRKAESERRRVARGLPAERQPNEGPRGGSGEGSGGDSEED